ncbi:TetR/AcrR family transcriptional regulator [Vibrio algarum]|uniref:TetR/AcrR family transcriptional regulator n=1 Tax=Vibrio algarum TaxID=3020714 RepID=A0ABT4YTS3_9VIBR|nr:TetR/AcrR family transcriptional regulator [Vibrio sp. KJ40-1]MDB1124973.1 TetR/AcrR family transcriptional regulator [Vibrio sp. KJ40-1]
MSKEQIAKSLEEAFSQHGFAEPSVAKLKTACNVSLRTLYKYYPSKEAMIAGALEHRHHRYLHFLSEGLPEDKNKSIPHIFARLEIWMMNYAPNGCMSMNAISAFPDNPLVNQAVKTHKTEIRRFLGTQSEREDLATALYLLHEGVSSAWPVLGGDVVKSAEKAALCLLSEQPPLTTTIK